jgi:thiol-disulfide isomerase/thioredoxin
MIAASLIGCDRGAKQQTASSTQPASDSAAKNVPPDYSPPTDAIAQDATPAKQAGDSPTEDGQSDTAEDEMIAGLDDVRLKRAYVRMKKDLAAEPQDVMARLNMSNVLQHIAAARSAKGEGDKGSQAYLAAAKLARELAAEGSEIPEGAGSLLAQVFFNEACALGKAGQAEDAVKSLDAAFHWGFTDFDLVKSDEDLTAVREMADFSDRLAGWEKVVKETAQRHAMEELAKGTSFPFDFDLMDLDDKPLKLADFKGKVVIVDIWGTWCPPCRAELPSFIKLQKTYGPQGFQMIGLNYENGKDDETAKMVREFIAAHGINYPCALGDDATRDQIPDLEGYPTTLFLDAAGKVRAKVVGLHDYTFLEAIVATLLAEKTGDAQPATPEPTESK